jgi:DNA-binding MarR family transcriptional regulator
VSESEPSLIYVIGRVNQGIRREMRARLARVDLSVQQYTALSILRARPGLSNAQLARRSLIAPQSMLEVLAKLEARGLLKRDVDPGHSRILRAALTPKGRRLLERIDPAIEAIQDWLLADVSQADRHVMLQGMVSAMERLSARRPTNPAPAARVAGRRSPSTRAGARRP